MSGNFRYFSSNPLWPKLLFGAGWGVFWLAGAAGESAPIPALFVGPGIMAAAMLLMTRKKQ